MAGVIIPLLNRSRSIKHVCIICFILQSNWCSGEVVAFRLIDSWFKTKLDRYILSITKNIENIYANIYFIHVSIWCSGSIVAFRLVSPGSIPGSATNTNQILHFK